MREIREREKTMGAQLEELFKAVHGIAEDKGPRVKGKGGTDSDEGTGTTSKVSFSSS